MDLGSPSSIQTSLSLKEGVVRLEDIFKEGAVVEEQKEKQIALAKAAMMDVANKRQKLFDQKFSHPQRLLEVWTTMGNSHLQRV